MNVQGMRVAFLGLGMMGAPMVRRLIEAGFDVTVWNRSADKCREFANGPARIASTPAEAASEADWILLCLLDTAVVDAVVFGSDGVVGALRPGSCVIDFSTIDPQWVRAADVRLREHQCQWIDAPVSGGVQGASAGTLTMFCGGDQQRIAAADPVLKTIAAKVTHFGDVGTGLAAKLCNQTIVATQLVAIAEALSLAERAGIDAAKLAQALQGGWADSTLLKIFGPRFAARTEQPRLGYLATMLETLDLARSLGVEKRLPMPLADAAVSVYHALAASGRLDRDLSALMDNYCR